MSGLERSLFQRLRTSRAAVPCMSRMPCVMMPVTVLCLRVRRPALYSQLMKCVWSWARTKLLHMPHRTFNAPARTGGRPYSTRKLAEYCESDKNREGSQGTVSFQVWANGSQRD